MGIGTENTHGYTLAVNGKIGATEIIVKNYSQWPDYVFADDYKLQSLEELEIYILANNHLPDVPTDIEVDENGINVGKMNAILLLKIEELTLHLIQQSHKLNAMEAEIKNLRNNLVIK